MRSFTYKLNRTRLLSCKKMPNFPSPLVERFHTKVQPPQIVCTHHPVLNWRSVLVTGVIPIWLTLACPRKRWMYKQSLVVPCMNIVMYFRQFCKVMWLRSEFTHVTQKLSFRTCKNNCMWDVTELVDFNPRTLHLGEDQLCTLNQTRLQNLSGYRLLQKDSAPWTECTTVCVNTYRIKLPLRISNS
jgi:hypothetical protein